MNCSASASWAGDDAGKGFAEEPAAQDIAPVVRKGVRREGIEGEHPLGDTGDGRDRCLGVTDSATRRSPEPAARWPRGDGVKRVPGFESEPCQEIAPALSRRSN